MKKEVFWKRLDELEFELRLLRTMSGRFFPRHDDDADDEGNPVSNTETTKEQLARIRVHAGLVSQAADQLLLLLE